MHPVLRNILAVVLGWVIGSVINMALVMVGGSIIPAPPGADLSTMEGMKQAFPLFETRHYIFPFLAHALGTLFGAAAAAWFSHTRKMEMAFVVGALFLAGGAAMVMMMPSPAWFNALDLIVAYLPMAYLGWKLAVFRQGRTLVQPG